MTRVSIKNKGRVTGALSCVESETALSFNKFQDHSGTRTKLPRDRTVENVFPSYTESLLLHSQSAISDMASTEATELELLTKVSEGIVIFRY